MRSVMAHQFSRIPRTNTPRSSFDRSHGLKTAFDSGYLVPIECQEVLPGDEVNMHADFLARLGPCVTPPMDNVMFDTQWFFVPSRLLWTNFTKMMGERVNPKDSIDYITPTITAPIDGFGIGSLADYFGIPPKAGQIKVNALPFRAYAKIWDEWYRDENLQDSIIQSTADLGDSAGSIEWNTLLRRGKRHDYFTACLPAPQKGEGVEIPLADSAPVISTGLTPIHLTDGNGGNFSVGVAGSSPKTLCLRTAQPDAMLPLSNGASPAPAQSSAILGFAKTDDESGFSTGLYADLTSATAATINSLRLAFQLQRVLEAEARGGSRYCELLSNIFGTVCPDARLQRSEYLGGSSDRIVFAPIAQNSASADTPQGNLVSQGKVIAHVNWHKSFTEHGYVIGLANVRCDLNYQQGLNRMWSRTGRFSYFWPQLQNIGEQAVLNQEIFCTGPSIPGDEEVFGYQERYAEYRYAPSLITGKMRTADTDADWQSLDVWHLAQYFATRPALNAAFIQDTPPLKRVLAVQDEPEIILDAYLGQTWVRPMGLYGVPGLIDHL